jgi:hypothetical protein
LGSYGIYVCHHKYAEIKNDLKESHQIFMDNKYVLEGYNDQHEQNHRHLYRYE